MAFNMSAPIQLGISPSFFQRYQTELLNFVTSYLTTNHDRKRFFTECETLRFSIPDRSKVRLDLAIQEVVDSRPIKRKYVYFIDNHGKIEYTQGCEGQHLYLTPIGDWVRYVQNLNAREVQKRFAVIADAPTPPTAPTAPSS